MAIRNILIFSKAKAAEKYLRPCILHKNTPHLSFNAYEVS